MMCSVGSKFKEDRGDRCLDPFNRHNKVISKCLKTISLDMARNNPTVQLVPGKKLCVACIAKIKEYGEKEENNDDGEEALKAINQKPADELNINREMLEVPPIKIQKLSHDKGDRCLDPLNRHKKVISKCLKTISLEMAHNHPTLQLVPGEKLCVSCIKKVEEYVRKKDNYDDDGDDAFKASQDAANDLNVTCEALGVSPIRIKKLDFEKRCSAAEKKIEKISSAVKTKFNESFHLHLDESSSTKTDDYNILLNNLKEKFNESKTVSEKVKILSLVPDSWSVSKTCDEFGASQYLARNTQKLVKKYGILPDVELKNYRRISDDIVHKVKSFYESDENSRMCPGRKDCVSVRNNYGEKESKQKKLILCNLKELYHNFCVENLTVKIGFSKFAELRPKWCVLAGSSGTHSVCVCAEHQNVKLMLQCAKLEDYKKILEAIVCDLENEKCMLNECDDCPGMDSAKSIVTCQLEKDDFFHLDNVTYPQWVSTDRVSLIKITKSVDEFIEDLMERLRSLKKHHYISKAQSNFMKRKKEDLDISECIVIGDFSENYSFIVQDEIQSFHWVNEQATLHPFVVYYKQGANEPIMCKSFCIISDCVKHDTKAVYAFQKALLRQISDIAPQIKTIVYFSDGAASQYKNRYNFANLCHHEKDFGFRAEWHFFATSHGKGPCDGIGGTVKRLVSKASLQRPADPILTPKSMFDFCSRNINGIFFLYVSKSDVFSNTELLEERFSRVKPVPHTRLNHGFVPVNSISMKCFITSHSNNCKEVQIFAHASSADP